MSVVFQSWGFYRQQLMEEAEHSGWPVVRHMMLVYPNNTMMYLRYQFMLGTELLVAPVHEKIDLFDEIRLFLPEKTSWIHIWTGTKYTGTPQTTYNIIFDHIIIGENRWVHIKAPLGQPVVLYIEGSRVGLRFVENLKQRKLL